MANNTNWLNISQMTGGTGETALSLTALTNNTLSAKTATITAKNDTYNVSGTTTVTIQGFVPTLTLSQSTIRFLTSGGTATFTVFSNTAWTINFPSIVQSYSVSAGTGNTEVTIAVGSTTETDPIIQVGTVQDVFGVNQLFLTIIQDNFIPEITVIPDGQAVFPETGGSLTFTVISNCDWHYNQFGPEWQPGCDWLHTDTISGTSGTTTVIVTADANGPRERLAYIGFYATDDVFVVLDAIQLAYIPSYITVTPSSWEFPYTEAGKTFIVDSFPEWTGEIVSTGETPWESTVYMEASFVIPSAMTMPLYTERGSSTYAIYLGSIKQYGSSVTFESAGTYKIQYQLNSGGTVPSLKGNTYLTDLYFTDNIGAIPSDGFSGCSSLTGIISDSVYAPSIASNTFYGVATGGTLVYPTGSNYNSWLSPMEYYLGYYGWPGFNGTDYITVEFNVTSTTQPTRIIKNPYGISAIKTENGENLPLSTGYTFPQTGRQTLYYYMSGAEIRNGVFEDCSDIVSVVLADTTLICNEHFINCSSLTSLTLNDGLKTLWAGTSYLRHPPLQTLVVPNSVTNSPSFLGCKCSSITLSERMTEINTFESCSLLTGITIPASVTGFSSSNCFRNCSSLRSVIYYSSFSSLPVGCFSNCSQLNTFKHQGSARDFDLGAVSSLGNYCFSNCANLPNEVSITGVTSLGEYCFDSVGGVINMYIGDGVATIPMRFCYSGSVTNLYIGKNVTSISSRAFMHCYNLKSITVASTTVPSLHYDYAFSDIPKTGTVYYRDGLDYSSWQNYSPGGYPFRNWQFIPIQFDT